MRNSLHWIDGPKNEGETSNSTEEGLGLVIFTSDGMTTIQSKLVNDDEIGNATESIPAPFLAITATESSKETSKDHDHIGNNGDENIGTAKTSQEGKIEEQERGCEGPVHISGVVDLTVDVLNSVWNVLVGLDDLDVLHCDAITRSHGEVGEEGEGGDKGSDDMEEPFLLMSDEYRCRRRDFKVSLTTGTLKAIA